MSVISASSGAVTSGGGGGSFPSAENPSVATLDLTLANTEYSHVFPSGLKRFVIQNRFSKTVQLSYVTGFTTVYWTLFPGQSYSEENLDTTGTLTIYAKSTVAGQLLEILAWT